jgi:hypothetical protein
MIPQPDPASVAQHAAVLARDLTDTLETFQEPRECATRVSNAADATIEALSDLVDALDAVYDDLDDVGRDENTVSRLARACDWHADQYPDLDGLTPDESYHAGKAAAYADAVILLTGSDGPELKLHSETEAER